MSDHTCLLGCTSFVIYFCGFKKCLLTGKYIDIRRKKTLQVFHGGRRNGWGSHHSKKKGGGGAVLCDYMMMYAILSIYLGFTHFVIISWLITIHIQHVVTN